jgi:HK97 family phage major capsid protein
MDELLKQLKALAESISTISGRIDTLEAAKGSADDLKAFKAELEKQKAEVTEEIKKLKLEGVQGLNRTDSNKIKAIANFVALARKGTFEGAVRTSEKSDGGYFVPPEIEAGILTLATAEGNMRALADVRGCNRDTVIIRVRVSGASAGHVGEEDSRDTTGTAKYAEIEIPIFTQYADPEISEQALEDPDEDLAAELEATIAEALGVQDETDFITGNGVKKPKGILAYDFKACTTVKDLEWGKIGTVKTGKAQALADTNPQDVFTKAKSLLKMKYRTGAILLVNTTTAGVMEQLKDTTGRPLWSLSLRDGYPATFAGIPVQINDYLPDITNTDGLPFAVLGNFKKGYAIRDRRGMSMLRDPYSKHGWVKFYTTKRTGAGVKDFFALIGIKAVA